MKILFLAPLTRKISPQITASRPRFIFDLVLELKKRGHEITILGTKDSRIPGIKFIPVINKGFYDMSSLFENPFYVHVSFLVKQAKLAEKISADFDIIHNHSYPEFINLLIDENLRAPMITTLHVSMTEQLDETLSLFPNAKIVCSETAKILAKKTRIYETVNHGVNTDFFSFEPKKEDYLLWIGRLGKAKDEKGNFIDLKGVKWAIRLAKETNSNLIMGGNVEDVEFFNKEVKPHLNEKIRWLKSVSFEQPLSREEVAELMQKAKTFLMMSEIFGLTALEAQSCGTPVIGFLRKPKSKIIIDGKTGFMVEKNIDALKDALKKIPEIKPENCRKHIEENFNVNKMVFGYEKIYKRVIKEHLYKKQKKPSCLKI